VGYAVFSHKIVAFKFRQESPLIFYSRISFKLKQFDFNALDSTSTSRNLSGIILDNVRTRGQCDTKKITLQKSGRRVKRNETDSKGSRVETEFHSSGHAPEIEGGALPAVA
jgi:hypothetical protein